jgi:hypothetical protein
VTVSEDFTISALSTPESRMTGNWNLWKIDLSHQDNCCGNPAKPQKRITGRFAMLKFTVPTSGHFGFNPFLILAADVSVCLALRVSLRL